MVISAPYRSALDNEVVPLFWSSYRRVVSARTGGKKRKIALVGREELDIEMNSLVHEANGSKQDAIFATNIVCR